LQAFKLAIRMCPEDNSNVGRWESLTEINELFDGQRRRIELRIYVQHSPQIAKSSGCQSHLDLFKSSKQRIMILCFRW